MEVSEQINNYLNWNIQKTAMLARKKCSIEKCNNSLAVLDMPNFLKKEDYQLFFEIAKLAGYNNFNLGLTPVWKETFTLPKNLLKTLSIVSAHGTSVKQEVSTTKPYREFLTKDLELLEELDPDKKWLINYDLFAGHPSELNFDKSFKRTQGANMILLANKLNLIKQDCQQADLLILEKIISDVAFVFQKTDRHICFEIPGTKGWSMFPSITANNLEYIIHLIQKYLPAATLCIDVGHIVTWTRSKEKILEIFNVLKNHSPMISMLHISSAGSNQRFFIDAYKAVYGNQYPDWHIKSLDLSLPVFEPAMLELIDMLRKCSTEKILEVSETRLPSVAIKDYFEKCKLQINDRSYYVELIKQGELLSYSS